MSIKRHGANCNQRWRYFHYCFCCCVVAAVAFHASVAKLFDICYRNCGATSPTVRLSAVSRLANCIVICEILFFKYFFLTIFFFITGAHDLLQSLLLIFTIIFVCIYYCINQLMPMIALQCSAIVYIYIFIFIYDLKKFLEIPSYINKYNECHRICNINFSLYIHTYIYK